MKEERQSLNRFELSKFDLQKIKELLREKPRPSKELMEKLGISSSVLKNRIDELMKRGEIESEEQKDRRKRLYKIADEEKVKVSRSIYLATQFLESLENPSFKEVSGKFEDYEVTVSLFFQGSQSRKTLDNYIAKAMRDMSYIIKTYGQMFKGLDVGGALVVTAEKKPREEKAGQ